MHKAVVLTLENAHISTENKGSYCDSCGIDIEDEYDNYLTDFMVRCANGEERFAEVTNFYCGDCLLKIMTLMVDIGFADHHHGGINFLEDTECPGYHNLECPYN